MNISFFKMTDEYVCSTKIEEQFDFEDMCNDLIAFSLKESLIKVVPRLNEIKDKIEVKAEWSYESYRVLIYGVQITEDELGDYIREIDQIKKLKLCEYFCGIYLDQRDYTRIRFAYDFRHYHKVLADAHRFVILTSRGLDEFLEALGMPHDYLPFEYEKLAVNLHFTYDEEREKEIKKEKLRGDCALPKVNFRRS